MNDKLTAEERAIFLLARSHEDPSDAVRERVHDAVLARVGTAVAVGATVAAASATAKAAGVTTVYTGKTILSSLLIVAGCAAVGLGAGLATRPDVSPPPAAATVVPPASGSAPARALPPAPSPAPPVASAPAPLASSPPTAPPSAAPEDHLASELALLQQAQKKIRAGDPRAALSLLDEHARRHPRGALQQEAAAARILALCDAGRREEARAEAARFLEAAPSSPLAERVRNACP